MLQQSRYCFGEGPLKLSYISHPPGKYVLSLYILHSLSRMTKYLSIPSNANYIKPLSNITTSVFCLRDSVRIQKQKMEQKKGLSDLHMITIKNVTIIFPNV